MEPDAELITRCLEGRQAAAGAFGQIYTRHAGVVLGFLRGLTHDEDRARDALQDTFLRFLAALPSFDRSRPVRPYLLRIARNLVVDSARRRARVEASVETEEAEDEGPSPSEVASSREVGRLLRGAVDQLPEAERTVFLLRHDQGLTYAEVAAAAGCSVRTAKYGQLCQLLPHPRSDFLQLWLGVLDDAVSHDPLLPAGPPGRPPMSVPRAVLDDPKQPGRERPARIEGL